MNKVLNSTISILTAIILASTTLAILFVGIPENIDIAYAGDYSHDSRHNSNAHQLYSLTASGISTIDLNSAQFFQATQNNGCDKLDGDATWCV
jgi:hypothetical protein